MLAICRKFRILPAKKAVFLPFQYKNKSSKNLAKPLHSSKKILFKKQKLPVYSETGSMIREKENNFDNFSQKQNLLLKSAPATATEFGQRRIGRLFGRKNHRKLTWYNFDNKLVIKLSNRACYILSGTMIPSVRSAEVNCRRVTSATAIKTARFARFSSAIIRCR